MKSNRNKATLTLGVVTVGFFASYPFSQSFLGGLLCSGCQAAMVGGMADWFAVTAFFRKPLGISFRTALIPRNRERIFRDLIDMVQNRLLTRENIIRELSRYNFAGYLLEYLESHGGKDGVKSVLRKVSGDIVQKIEPSEIGAMVEVLVKKQASKVMITPIAVQAAGWSIKAGYTDKVIVFLLDEMTRLAKHEYMAELMAKIIAEALAAYEKEYASRKFVSVFMDLSPVRLAKVGQSELVAMLERLKEENHPLRLQCMQWLEQMLDKIANDTVLQQRLEEWKLKVVSGVDIQSIVAGFIDFLRSADGGGGIGEAVRIFKWLNNTVDTITQEFKDNAEQQRQVDEVIKGMIANLVDTYHPQIGLTVKTALDKYSNDMLVEFIETKVGNDLQMIRINGSVVGGLVGMLIFVISYWIG